MGPSPGTGGPPIRGLMTFVINSLVASLDRPLSFAEEVMLEVKLFQVGGIVWVKSQRAQQNGYMTIGVGASEA